MKNWENNLDILYLDILLSCIIFSLALSGLFIGFLFLFRIVTRQPETFSYCSLKYPTVCMIGAYGSWQNGCVEVYHSANILVNDPVGILCGDMKITPIK